MRGIGSLAITACLGLTSLSIPQLTTALTRTSDTQTYPIISLDTKLARDADTFSDDKALNTACRKLGETSEVCLCVSHVMKYELTLTEYRAAARLYGQPQKREKLRAALRNDGFGLSDIGTAEQMERTLTSGPDFALRCAEAKAYYKQSRG